MKRSIILLILFSVFFYTGCKEEKALRFCEGKKPDGQAVNCGSVFSAGDLSIFIKAEESFGVDKLKITIYEKNKFKNEITETITLKVKPGEKRASADIRLYKEGKYIVEVAGKDDLNVARGEVRIMETY